MDVAPSRLHRGWGAAQDRDSLGLLVHLPSAPVLPERERQIGAKVALKEAKLAQVADGHVDQIRRRIAPVGAASGLDATPPTRSRSGFAS